ncbi:hypothetical protein NDU88_006181 [Pleurodeles waltl]|uniref:Uncharacterized protein n=1 Tax=Pleurodeles waltl TaxID=8319 RepID=A0AAV7X1U3_PLEWA|nr:hypothetical protein NDU88_006181 [Pleurodeles waltl]
MRVAPRTVAKMSFQRQTAAPVKSYLAPVVEVEVALSAAPAVVLRSEEPVRSGRKDPMVRRRMALVLVEVYCDAEWCMLKL